MDPYLRIVVTGDVDSGKSTLIGRFMHEMGALCPHVTGNDFEFSYLLDSFEEERINQLTIDTTQVYCKGRGGCDFIFIDVPGHKEFIRNMLTGSSYADTAILLVDVQKSVKEQTRRHAFILRFLGIEDFIIAINKMDTVDFKEDAFRRVKVEILEALSDLGINTACFIPVSAQAGVNLIDPSPNLPWYRGESLLKTLNSSSKKEAQGYFRFPIQDIYERNGERIAVGEVISGDIKKGEKVIALPAGYELRVTGISVFKKNKARAGPGESIAVRFNDMTGLSRGQIICKPELPKIKSEIEVRFFCIKHIDRRDDLRFACATQDKKAHIKEIKDVRDTATLQNRSSLDSIEATEIAHAVVKMDGPVAVDSSTGMNKLARFVLKNADNDISAVGVIL